ncbi:hypothetical protein BCR39DRAFT_587588 [Naematelia encephala]|uniref:Uncharacterized protein n=1 Tax=Naematelia encephala TaxID=71784 RepID=A0A1Y2B8T7_9TREE|nr:hypothetical protein BCR39DRAFT_587588 [Naematelia encephala]
MSTESNGDPSNASGAAFSGVPSIVLSFTVPSELHPRGQIEVWLYGDPSSLPSNTNLNTSETVSGSEEEGIDLGTRELNTRFDQRLNELASGEFGDDPTELFFQAPPIVGEFIREAKSQTQLTKLVEHLISKCLWNKELYQESVDSRMRQLGGSDGESQDRMTGDSGTECNTSNG